MVDSHVFFYGMYTHTIGQYIVCWVGPLACYRLLSLVGIAGPADMVTAVSADIALFKIGAAYV